MKKILCPTDFSDTATNAVAYAAKLAQVANSTLTLFNVQSVFETVPVDLVRGKDVSIEAARQRINLQSLKVSRAFKISCYAEVEETSHKLSSVIKEKSKTYDLIVMGTNGADDLYQFFNGSNTYNAIVKSEIPLLLVPAGCGYSEIRSIAFAFDYFRQRNMPVARLLPIVKALNCELKVLQVMEESFSKEAAEYLKELQTLFRNFYAEDIKLTFDTIHAADNAQSINSFILRTQPDALVLSSEHHGLLGKLFHKSVIKHISAISTYPVFIIPSET